MSAEETSYSNNNKSGSRSSDVAAAAAAEAARAAYTFLESMQDDDASVTNSLTGGLAGGRKFASVDDSFNEYSSGGQSSKGGLGLEGGIKRGKGLGGGGHGSLHTGAVLTKAAATAASIAARHNRHFLEPLSSKFSGLLGPDCLLYRLHGNIPQKHRQTVYKEFCAAQIGVLFCTDVAARCALVLLCCAVLCCTVLYCTVLYYAVLCCAILCCAMLCYTVLNCAMLCSLY